MPLPDPLIEVLSVFRPLFTAPTWRKLMILLTGTLLLSSGLKALCTQLLILFQQEDDMLEWTVWTQQR
jgi:hypothetical protein